jgi:hypothetical protein
MLSFRVSRNPSSGAADRYLAFVLRAFRTMSGPALCSPTLLLILSARRERALSGEVDDGVIVLRGAR